MRKWQQELGQGDGGAPSNITGFGETTEEGGAIAETLDKNQNSTSAEGSSREGITREGNLREGSSREGNLREGSSRENSSREGRVQQSFKKLSPSEKFTDGAKITLTKYHYAVIVFCISLALFCILKPFFVQTTQKDRPYESPNLSFVTAFILSALVALGYLLACD